MANYQEPSGGAQENTTYSAPEHSVPKWYAIHTFAHHEKRVDERLSVKNVDTFLPLYSVRRTAKGVTGKIEKPLFPGYVFVFILLSQRLLVLQVPGVVKLVGSGGKPLPVEQQEIDSLLKARAMGIPAEPHPWLEIGRKVRITTGPFEGLQGILTRRKGKHRIVLALELIASSFVLDVDSWMVEPVKSVQQSGTVSS
jgi:transcription antitermination factor NusG